MRTDNRVTDTTHTDMPKLAEVDQIYAKKHTQVKPFEFDAQVADVFQDMINRSVPGYQSIVDMVASIGRHFITPNAQVYDLGCSLGALSFALAQDHQIPACRIQAIDLSQPMIDRCHELLLSKQNQRLHPITFKVGDIRHTPLAPSALILINFVLQFIQPEARDQVLARCFQAVSPGGALLISEKITFANPEQNRQMIELHHQYKQTQGYSALEISQKRTALENILMPDELTQLKTRLVNAGFTQIHLWLQCFNFVSLLAIK